MTPDQAVRVLRAGFSYNTSSVRITVAHHWADKAERAVRPPSSLSIHRGLMSASRSEGALSARSNNEETSESTSGAVPSLLAAPAIGKGGVISRRSSPPPRSASSVAPLPGVLAATAPVEVHRSDQTRPSGPPPLVPRPHTQGATKLRRDRPSLSVDQSTTTTASSEETVRGSCEEEESSLGRNITPASVSPAGSTSRFDSVLDMYDSHASEKFDTVPTLPPRPTTSKRKTAVDHARRKSSLQFPVMANGDHITSEIIGVQSIDRQTPTILPGSLIKGTTLRHRRVSNQNDIVGSASSGQTADSNASRATGVTELSRRFSPKLSSGQLRAWGSDDSLHLPTLEEEDRFNVGKPPRSLHTDDIKVSEVALRLGA